MQINQSQRSGSVYRYRFGTVEFDEARFELHVGGLVVELEQKPLRLLAELLRHADEAVAREVLFDAVWGGRRIIDHALTNAIAKLRKALGDGEETRIVTLPKVGYRLVGPVEKMPARQSVESRIELKAYEPVPGREQLKLFKPLALSHDSEVWLAQNVRTMESSVFKFSVDGERLGALKREATLYRVLRESLGVSAFSYRSATRSRQFTALACCIKT